MGGNGHMLSQAICRFCQIAHEAKMPEMSTIVDTPEPSVHRRLPQHGHGHTGAEVQDCPMITSGNDHLLHPAIFQKMKIAVPHRHHPMRPASMVWLRDEPTPGQSPRCKNAR